MNSSLSLLSDKDDAWRLFIASSNKNAYFVTADVRNVIKYENEINNICGVEALLSSFFRLLQQKTTSPSVQARSLCSLGYSKKVAPLNTMLWWTKQSLLE